MSAATVTLTVVKERIDPVSSDFIHGQRNMIPTDYRPVQLKNKDRVGYPYEALVDRGEQRSGESHRIIWAFRGQAYRIELNERELSRPLKAAADASRSSGLNTSF